MIRLLAVLAAACCLLAAEDPAAGWMVQAATRADLPPREDAWRRVRRIEGPLALANRAGFADLPHDPARDHLWYRKRFAVPAEWAGRSVWLRIEQVEGRALVVVAGRRIGEVSRLEPALALGDAVQPGRDADIDLFVTRDAAAAGLPPRPDPVLDHIAAWLKKPRPPGLGLVGAPRLEARGAGAWIAGLEVRTLHAAGRLEVRAELGGAVQGLACAALVEPLSDITAAVALPEVPARPGAVVIAAPFAGRPWRLEDPHLYRLTLALCRADGSEVDRRTLRFGIREVTVAGCEQPQAARGSAGGAVRGRAAPGAEPTPGTAGAGAGEAGVPAVGGRGRCEVRLNGRRTPWRMMGPITWSPATGWPTAAACSPTSAIGSFWTALGANLWQIQPNGDLWWQNQPRGGGVAAWQVVDDAILTACDEAGIGVTLPVPPMATNQGLILPIDRDPALAAAYRREVAAWLARYRHHPCIQAYTLGMNLLDTTSYMRNISPEGMGRSFDSPATPARMRAAIAAALAVVHELDPAVPAYVHAGGWWGGDLHGANQHMNLLPLAEYERWPERWAADGQAPWVADEAGTPFLGDFIFRRYAKAGGFDAKDPELAVTETCAEILGDRAYRLETAGQRRDPRAGIGHLEQYGTTHLLAPERHSRLPALEEVLCRYYPRVVRSWRAWGVQGMVPWLMEWSYAWQAPDLRDRLAAAYAGANQRFLAFLGGAPELWRRERHLAAGEALRRTAVLVYDGPRETCPVRLRWRLETAAGVRLAGGEERTTVPAGDRRDRPIAVAVPPVAARTDATLVLEADGDGVAQRDEQPLVLWPLAAPAPAVAVRPAAPGAADGLGALVRTDPEAGILLIGQRGLAGLERLPFTAADIDAGLRVLVLAQAPEDLFRLGLRCEERGFRQAFVREPAALAGIADDDLADWRGEAGLLPSEAPPSYWPHRLVMLGTKAQRPARCGAHGTVVSAAIETPQQGAFRPLVECGFDLAYAAVLEWRHGRGRVVFCQLDLAGRVGADPAATRTAAALLAGLAAECAPADRVLRIAGSGTAAAALAGLGFAPGEGPQALVLAPIGAATAADLRYRDGASPADGWRAATVDALPGLAPPAGTGIAIGPGLLRLRLPLPALEQEGSWLIAAAGGIACGIDPTAADAAPRSTGRLAAQRLRTLYQRLLTGAGARSSAAVAGRITTLGAPPAAPGQGGADFIPLVDWQATAPERVAGLDGRALLDAPWPEGPRWLDLAPLLARRDAAGYGGEAQPGHADLAAAFGAAPDPHQRARVRCRFRLAQAATVNLYAGADYWARVRIDGLEAIALAEQKGAPARPAANVRVDLAAGEHELEMRLVSGSNGFWGFLAADTAAAARDRAAFIPDIARHGRWLRPYNPPGSEALYLAPRGDDDDPYLYYLW